MRTFAALLKSTRLRLALVGATIAAAVVLELSSIGSAVVGRSTSAPLLGTVLVLLVVGGALLLARRPEPVLVEMRSLRPIEPLEPGPRPAGRRRRGTSPR